MTKIKKSKKGEKMAILLRLLLIVTPFVTEVADISYTGCVADVTYNTNSIQSLHTVWLIRITEPRNVLNRNILLGSLTKPT